MHQNFGDASYAEGSTILVSAWPVQEQFFNFDTYSDPAGKKFLTNPSESTDHGPIFPVATADGWAWTGTTTDSELVI